MEMGETAKDMHGALKQFHKDIQKDIKDGAAIVTRVLLMLVTSLMRKLMVSNRKSSRASPMPRRLPILVAMKAKLPDQQGKRAA